MDVKTAIKTTLQTIVFAIPDSVKKAGVTGVKGIVVNYTPPLIKYQALCGIIAACGLVAICTSEPNFAIGAIECATAIVKE